MSITEKYLQEMDMNTSLGTPEQFELPDVDPIHKDKNKMGVYKPVELDGYLKDYLTKEPAPIKSCCGKGSKGFVLGML